jgi:hypothetical protein
MLGEALGLLLGI